LLAVFGKNAASKFAGYTMKLALCRWREKAMPIQLEYAPRRPGMSSKNRRRLQVLSLVLACAVLYRLTPPAYRHLRHFYWVHQVRLAQQQCMDFTAPTDLVVYTDDQKERDSLLASSSLYFTSEWEIADSDTTYFSFDYLPEPLTRLRTALQQAYGSPFYGFFRGVFLHGRTGNAGNQRLVNVWATGAKKAGGTELVADIYSLSTNAPPHRFTQDIGDLVQVGEDPSGHSVLRIFAGQVDPVDLSHFTIQFTYDPGDDSEGGSATTTQPSAARKLVHGTIDGYLRANDIVDLLPRQGEILSVQGSCRKWRLRGTATP